MAKNQTDAPKIQIQVPENLKTGVYANAISVSVTGNDVVIDMGYIIPGSNPAQVVVVSRNNMSHSTAESFLKVLSDSLLDHRNKKSKKIGNI